MSSTASYSPNYFSVDDILTTQERVPCKFLTDVPKLGKMDIASEDDNLKAGTDLELPLWLAQPLSSGRQPVVSVSLPRVYRESYQEILKADPCAVDVYKLGLYFYELGGYIKRFDNRGNVGNILMQSFKTRFRYLIDLADNVGTDPLAQNRLDTLERHLFLIGNQARQKLNVWLMDSQTPLEAAAMVINHKKRKRVHLDDIM